jgi:hypothetical protein
MSRSMRSCPLTFLKGCGRATVADREFRYQPGDTLILPPAQVHQIFAETDPGGSRPPLLPSAAKSSRLAP